MAPKNPNPGKDQDLSSSKKAPTSSIYSGGIRMATRSSKETTNSVSKLRRATDVPPGTPESNRKRTGLVSYLTDIFSPSAEREKERMAEEEALKNCVEPPKPASNKPPLSAAETSMLQAKYIDARAAEYREVEAERAIHRVEHLEWNPDIMPNDPAYVRWKLKLTGQLQTRSVQSVLEENFSAAQMWTLQPSMDNGSALKVQEEATKEYKALLSMGGKFYGQADNLVTKLVLLKFGYPVAPLTHPNIFNASNNNPDEDDESEEPLAKSRYEEIINSEKPLEFLNVYNERSYGYRILRRAKSRYANVEDEYVPSLRGGAGSPLDLENAASKGIAESSPSRQRENRAPRLNKERIIKKRAAPAKLHKYNPWMIGQRRLDKLQCESWRKVHSVILPGQKPEPPLYGMTRELILGNTDALPTTYGQRLTPTDFHEILEENHRLRYQALERLEVCPLCNEKFEKYDAEEAKEHFAAHMEETESAGVCPICETEQWLMMDLKQRRNHLEYHQNQQDVGCNAILFDAVDCPVCDKQLSKIGDTEDILFHMAEHTPGVLRYCDHCGLHIKACDKSELQHHKRVCVDAIDRSASEEDHIYCKDCGLDRTFETEEGLVAHRKNCCAGKGVFCNRCGFNMTGIGEANQERHRGRCMPPRGAKKKFCQKCGENLANMDTAEKSFHKKSCFMYEPEFGTELDRQRNLKSLIQRQADLMARNKAQEAENRASLTTLQTKMDEFKEQEKKFKLQYAHNAGPCPMDKCSFVLTGLSPKEIIDHMEIHMMQLHCPLEHMDGDVICIHSQKEGLDVKLTTKQSNIFEKMRRNFNKYKNESEKAAVALKKRKKKEANAKTAEVVDQDEDRDEDVASSTTSSSSSTSFDNGDTPAGVAAPGGSANKRRKVVGWKGGRVSDPNYRFQPLEDIPIPENEIVPDHLSPLSPSKSPAKPSLKATDKKSLDDFIENTERPKTPTAKTKVVGRSSRRLAKVTPAPKATPAATASARKPSVYESSVTEMEDESEAAKPRAKVGVVTRRPVRGTRASASATPKPEAVKMPGKRVAGKKAKRGGS